MMNFIPKESPSKMGFMNVMRVIIVYETIEKSSIICQNTLILYNFHSLCKHFHKNYSRFVISIKNWVYRRDICICLMKKKFRKNLNDALRVFRQKIFEVLFKLKYLDLYVSQHTFWWRLRIWFLFKDVIKKEKVGRHETVWA